GLTDATVAIVELIPDAKAVSGVKSIASAARVTDDALAAGARAVASEADEVAAAGVRASGDIVDAVPNVQINPSIGARELSSGPGPSTAVVNVPETVSPMPLKASDAVAE